MYASTHTQVDAPDIVKAFLEYNVRHDGLFGVIISDRDPNSPKRFGRRLWFLWSQAVDDNFASCLSRRTNRTSEPGTGKRFAPYGFVSREILGVASWCHRVRTRYASMTPFEVDTERKVRNAVLQEFGSSATAEDVTIADNAKQFAGGRQRIIGRT